MSTIQSLSQEILEETEKLKELVGYEEEEEEEEEDDDDIDSEDFQKRYEAVKNSLANDDPYAEIIQENCSPFWNNFTI